MVIRYLKQYQLLSIENFQQVNLEDRLKINECIEKSYLISPISKGITDEGYNFALYKFLSLNHSVSSIHC